jgi:hypothetical protein
MADQTYTFKNPTGLSRWAKGLLYATIALSVIGLISGVMEYQLLSAIFSGAFESQDEMTEAANANDTRQGLISIAQIALAVVTGIVVLIWIHRANRNAHALGAKNMHFTPGWAVGWYFIPILNLWKPYQAMKEIWKASANPSDWQSQKTPALLPWWWFFWIATNIFGQIVFRVSLGAEEMDELTTASLLGIAADALDIPLDVLMIVIIGRITGMQMGHFASLPEGRGPEPETAPAPAA